MQKDITVITFSMKWQRVKDLANIQQIATLQENIRVYSKTCREHLFLISSQEPEY